MSKIHFSLRTFIFIEYYYVPSIIPGVLQNDLINPYSTLPSMFQNTHFIDEDSETRGSK